MAENKFTPEEKLLEIIEGRGGEADARAAGGHTAENHFSSVLLARMRGFFTLHIAAQALMVLAALASIFFILDFVRNKMDLQKKFNLVVKEPVLIPEDDPLGISVDLPAVLRQAREKKIFTLEVFNDALQEKKSSSPIEVGALKLVGVLWSQNPEAIIEDTASKKTYMLKRGDDILRWKVKDILPDKAVIASDEGEWELQ